MPNATVTDDMGVALAELLMAQAATAIYMGIGSGLASWDLLTTPPQPDRAQQVLYNEIARVLVTAQYLSEAGIPTVFETNRLEFAGQFGVNVANGTLREMGLFIGGPTINTGRLIAVSNFPAISKPAGGGDFSLTRIMRPVLLAR